MPAIRAFVAVKLPHDVIRALEEVIVTLSGQVPGRSVRWVKSQALHLTLRFLGDTEPERLAAVATSMDDVAGRFSAFTLSLSGLGAFPNQKRPRVIWCGLGGNIKELATMKQELDARLAPFGWAEERGRPYQPHLTLGRVRDSRQFKDVAWAADLASLTLPVDAMHLVESRLRPEGPVYTVRHTSPLMGPE